MRSNTRPIYRTRSSHTSHPPREPRTYSRSQDRYRTCNRRLPVFRRCRRLDRTANNRTVNPSSIGNKRRCNDGLSRKCRRRGESKTVRIPLSRLDIQSQWVCTANNELSNFRQYLYQIIQTRNNPAFYVQFSKRLFRFDLVINCCTFRYISKAAGVGLVLYNYYMHENSIFHTCIPHISYYRGLFTISGTEYRIGTGSTLRDRTPTMFFTRLYRYYLFLTFQE